MSNCGIMHRAWIYCNIFSTVLLYSGLVNGYSKQPENGIVISLTNFNPSLMNGQAFLNQSLLDSSSESSINIKNVPSEISFIIIQVHTHESNITLSSKRTATSEVCGYHVGLHINSSDLSDTKISVTNNNNVAVAVMIAAVAYTSKAPVPGGCNMESNVEVAPYQELTLTDAIVAVKAPPASAPITNGESFSCEKDVTYHSYRLYIPEGDFSDDTYFSAITKMLTVDDITDNGEKVSPALLMSPLSRTFSAYPGTGSVYVMVAAYDNHSAAYVPSFSYACSPVSNFETCCLLKTPLSKVLCATIFFVGISLTFFGHRYSPFQIMLLSSVTGGIIGNTILNMAGLHDPTWQISLTIVIGLMFGVVCAGCWCADKPCPAILQATFTLGAMIASITYFGISDDNSSFKNNAIFWCIYVAICLMTVLLLCACSMSSIMICYSIIGSYAIILPIDYWLGSNLKYIIINTIRRISVPGFNVVAINPPIQATDIWLSSFWVFLALFGFYIQRRGLNGRLPFPCRGKNTTIMSGSNFPLLSAERGNRRVLVLHRDDRVYQSTW